jgi:hypothetical protein
MTHPHEAQPDGQPEFDSHGLPVMHTRAVGQDHPGGHQAVHLTFALSASNPVVQLLPRDYDRMECRVVSTGGTPAAVVLAQTKEIAEAAAQQGATFTGAPTPGSYLPASLDRVIRSGDELWCAWLGTAALVSVIAVRRIPETLPNRG